MNARFIAQRTGFTGAKDKDQVKSGDIQTKLESNRITPAPSNRVNTATPEQDNLFPEDRKTLLNKVRVEKSRARRSEWLQGIEQNTEFIDEYRQTAALANKEHLDLHKFREEHTLTGEIGIQVRSYTTAKQRADNAQSYFKDRLQDRGKFNGNYQQLHNVQRAERKVIQTQPKLTFKATDEHARAKTRISLHGRDYLPENFDFKLFKNPKYKEHSPEKWMTNRGFDTYAGVKAAHVVLTSPGQARTESHQQSVTEKKSWKEPMSEENVGANPFGYSYKEKADKFIQRPVVPPKKSQKGESLFVSTCRPSQCVDDKIRIQSLNQMEMLQRSYIINKGASRHSGSRGKEQNALQTSMQSSYINGMKGEINSGQTVISPGQHNLMDKQPFMRASSLQKQGSYVEQDFEQSIAMKQEIIQEEHDENLSNQASQESGKYSPRSPGSSPRNRGGNDSAMRIGSFPGSPVLPSSHRKLGQKNEPGTTVNQTPPNASIELMHLIPTDASQVKNTDQTANQNVSQKVGSQTHRIDKRYKQMTCIQKDPQSVDQASRLYEKWRNNPLVTLKNTDPNLHQGSFRNSANKTLKDKTQRVDDFYLAQKMLPKKTYYTALKESVSRHPKHPVYYPEKLSQYDYEKVYENVVRSPEQIFGQKTYNLSYYAPANTQMFYKSPKTSQGYNKPNIFANNNVHSSNLAGSQDFGQAKQSTATSRDDRSRTTARSRFRNVEVVEQRTTEEIVTDFFENPRGSSAYMGKRAHNQTNLSPQMPKINGFQANSARKNFPDLQTELIDTSRSKK